MKPLSRALGYTFVEPVNLQLALTHRSVGAKNNERLEFLGDSIINFIIASELYERFPAASEGQLTRMRAQLVCAEMLTKIAKQLGLGQFIVLGSGEMRSGGHHRSSILADGLEAMVGAIYLDSGNNMPVVKQTVLGWYTKHWHAFNDDTLKGNKDAKTVLQELLQAKKMPLPVYKVVRVEGEHHDQTFFVECTVALLQDAILGIGNNRRKAEQVAAEKILEEIKKHEST